MPNFWFKLPKPIIALAPMAGYTDSAFRLVCKHMGADVVYSEMMSVDGICYQNKKTLDMLKFNNQECPVIFQLFGNKVERFKEAVRAIGADCDPPLPSPIGIDLNFGCPAHKVFKTGSGAALMNDLDKAYNIIKAVCENTKLPVSIKIRTKVKNTTAIDFIEKIKPLHWSAIMIHGRSLKQGFTGEIDFKMIKKIKQLVPDKIVLANGGVNAAQDAIQMINKTGADGIGIARGALGNPWIFSHCRGGLQSAPTDWQNIKQTILEHAKLFLQHNDNLIPLRKHLVHYVKGQKNASELRQKLIKVETIEELEGIL